MAEAYIVDAVRTPVGKRGGSLAGMHTADLGAHVLKALVDRVGVDPGAVEDVVMGCTDTIGSQAGDIARTAWLVAGLPDHVPGVTIDRQCGSSQQAVHFAAQGVMSGTQDLVVAGGLQNMSAIPISAAMIVGQEYGFSTPFAESPGWQARYGDQEVSQFRSAEMIAEKWDISREDMERFAYESHQRAIRAIDEGRFANEIVPVGEFTTDEGPRRETSLEKMAGLQPLAPGGRITAAVASQISDAASAMLMFAAAGVSGPWHNEPTDTECAVCHTVKHPVFWGCVVFLLILLLPSQTPVPVRFAVHRYRAVRDRRFTRAPPTARVHPQRLQAADL